MKNKRKLRLAALLAVFLLLFPAFAVEDCNGTHSKE